MFRLSVLHRAASAVAALLMLQAVASAQDQPFEDDFESGLSQWEMTDAAAWEIVEEDGNHVLGLMRPSKYETPVRSPLSRAIVKGREYGSFELTVKMKQTGREYGHRDLCVFFGYQDPSHFYYVHLASVADEHANSIFLVNAEPRRSIAETRTDGTQWDEEYHTIKIRRDLDSGRIEVFFDDMNTPVMTATDKTLAAGQVGLGSFDDVGRFDDFRVTPIE